jgi:hypothetical protein
MTAKMKALVKSRPEPGLWLEEVPVAEIGINVRDFKPGDLVSGEGHVV